MQWKKILVGLFLLSIWLPLIEMKVQFVPQIGRTEKRTLKAFPPFNFRSLGQWTSDFESSFNDNFGFRQFLIRENSWLLAKVFRVSAVPTVVMGNGGWLFYKSEAIKDGTSLSDYQGQAALSAKDLTRMATDLASISATLRENNLRFFVLVAPNKSTIYEQDLPDAIRRKKGFSRLDQLEMHLASEGMVTLIDVRQALRQSNALYPSYYKTDSHWNNWGGLVATQVVVEEIRKFYPETLPVTLSDYQVATGASYKVGDLATLLGLPGEFADWEINPTLRNGSMITEEKVDYSGNIHGFREINSRLADGPKVLVFGDSYSSALRRFLPEQFSQSWFIGLSSSYHFRTDIILQEHPDIVIWEVAERFLDKLQL